MLTRLSLVAGFAICAVACQRSPSSIILGEWTQQRTDPRTHFTLSDRITYRSDHTWTRIFEDGRGPARKQSGTWRIDGPQILWRSADGDTQGEIFKLTRDEFRVGRPGDVGVYTRSK